MHFTISIRIPIPFGAILYGPDVVLILCGSAVYSTRRFMFGLALLFVYVFLLSFQHFDHLDWGRGSWSLCLSFVSYAHVNLCRFFSFLLVSGVAATSACGSSWTFPFTFFFGEINFVFRNVPS